MRIFRFAPTPNFYLHYGHGVSACLNGLLAQQYGGEFLLRIDNIDMHRSKEIYSDAAINDLKWLGIKFDSAHIYTQTDHRGDYENALRALQAHQILYHCNCTRNMVQDHSRYPQFCRDKIITSTGALNRAIDNHENIRIDGAKALKLIGSPALTIADDYIIRRKDIGGSYHLATVIDDYNQKITDIIRGQDLQPLMGFHILLQKLLDLPNPAYWHHPLITLPNGEKLAKSKKNIDRIQNHARAHYWDLAHEWQKLYRDAQENA